MDDIEDVENYDLLHISSKNNLFLKVSVYKIIK